MEPCAAIERDLEKVVTKFTSIRDYSDRILSHVIEHFREMENRANSDTDNEERLNRQRITISEGVAQAKDTLTNLAKEHRDLHGFVSKVGKSIDRNFTSDFTSTARTDALANEENVQLLNKVIAQHFYRQGMDDVADTLIKESGLPVEEICPEPYAELHRIWESIQAHDLEPALRWAIEYRDALERKNSSIEFKLHRLAFLQILGRGISSQSEAITYARLNFSKFVHRFEREIQALMGTLMFLPNGVEHSPYKHLIASEMWVEAADTFLKDACNALDINRDSPLAVVVNSGCTALPALLNLKQVMMSRQVLGIWNGRDELPIEIDLDPENRYHSIFACPILRQQSSDANPPMKLTCGHVISRDALNKISNGPILKCPYCPMEQSPSDAKLIYF